MSMQSCPHTISVDIELEVVGLLSMEQKEHCMG